MNVSGLFDRLMPDPRIETWRRRAEQSFQRAEHGPAEEDRVMWRRIGEHWLDLAARLEQLTEKNKDST